MQIRRLLVRVALGVATLIVVVIALFAINGVPKPPGVSAHHMPRLRWRSAMQVSAVVRDVGQTIGSAGWPDGTDHLWTWVGNAPRRQHRALSAPGDTGRAIAALPPSVSQIAASGNPEHPVVVVGLDQGGSEESRLYAWVPGGDSIVPITPGETRLNLCCVNRPGTLVAFGTEDMTTGEAQVRVADVRTGTVRSLMSGSSGDAWATSWSPDGRSLLAVQQSAFTRGTPYVVDAETGHRERLVPAWGDTMNVVDAQWSHDQQTIFVATDAGSEFTGVVAVDRASKRTRNLTADLPHDVTQIQLLGNSDTLIITVNDGGASRLYGLDSHSGARWPLPTPPGNLESAQAHPSASRVVEVVASPDGRRGVYVLDVATGKLTPWATGAPPGRAALPVPTSETYPTFDSVGGKPRGINVVVERPPAEMTGPWPVLIVLHGGPTAQSFPTPDRSVAAFRRAGIAVLEPNVRGSTGFGRTFAGLDDGRRREDAVRDVGALLDWIGTQRDLDASRVCVLGGSYGGYMALASLVHYSSRLRCGTDLFGISDLPAFLTESEHGHYAGIQRAEFGDERDAATRAFLDSISPIRHADQITVPLLVFQGANDPRVKPAESQRMVSRMDSLGRTVWFITAANEGHGLEQPLNQLYVGTAVFDLLKDYLLPKR